MNLPELVKTKDNVTVLNAFLGINKGLHINENEFEDMSNMTNDYYPVLTNRKKRGLTGKTLTNPQGFLGGQELAYVDDNKLYYGSELVCSLSDEYDERQLVLLGAYLCVFPDGIVYNTSTRATPTSIKNVTTTSSTVTMTMCKYDATEITGVYSGTEAPSDTTTYPYWLDTSQSTTVLKMWSSTYSEWTSVATTYVKISATGIGSGLNPYDAVRISGITIKGVNDYDFNYSNGEGNTLLVYKCSDDYILVAGLLSASHTQTSTVTVTRPLPDMDFVCEQDNRIWGCSSENHEVYACKQGDPLNWACYAGLDSDSYAATVGTQDDFTGIASYSGYVFFFKEDGFHKLYGTKPSNYEMIWKPCRGVAKGCDKSIAIVDEILIFKSRDAIVAYDGSEETISDKLGVNAYYDAVAVGYRNKYYISMRDADFNYRMYVYDMTKATWCVEDDIRCKYMVYANNAAYIVNSDNELLIINNEKIYSKYFPNQTALGDEYLYPQETLYLGNILDGTLESNYEWSLTTGDLGLDNPYNKYLKRINVRMELDTATKLKIEVEYDSSGEWEYVTEYYASRKKSYEIPIAVQRADHVRIRLSGWGDFKLFAIAKAVEAGSGENEE